MTHCAKCRRPLRLPSPDGYGPVCRKTAAPIPTVGRDLFGFDVRAAAAAARERVLVHIEIAAVEALMAIRHQAAAARRRLGLWA